MQRSTYKPFMPVANGAVVPVGGFFQSGQDVNYKLHKQRLIEFNITTSDCVITSKSIIDAEAVALNYTVIT